LRKESHIDFIKHMDKRYGPHWLTTDTAGRILYQLGSHGLFSRSLTFTKFLSSRFVKPDAICLRTVINHCRILKNFEGAIQALTVFAELGVEPDATVYNDLFFMAVEGRLYSYARIVWRYACLSCATTYRMRMTLTSMACRCRPADWQSPSPGHLYRPREIYRTLAGKVILGTTKILNHPATKPLGISNDFHDPETTPPPLDDEPGVATERYLDDYDDPSSIRMWTRTQMDLDLSIHEWWKPAELFEDALAQAYELDVAWNEEKIWTKHGLDYMMRNAKPILLRRKLGGLWSNTVAPWV